MRNLITKKEIDSALSQRVKAIGVDEQTFNKEVSYAIQHVKKNKTLQQADHTSIMEAILNCLQVGLSLNPVSKLGYLVPRWDSLQKKNICAFEPSYQGYVKLLTDTKSVVAVHCHLVYGNETFEVNYGTTVEIVHKPVFKDRGELIAVYAIGILPGGEKIPEVMGIDEVSDIRGRSDSYRAFKAGKIKSCVWESDFGEMSRKTVIRRIFKYLPKSEQFERMAKAISFDEGDYSASADQIGYIESLLETSALSIEKQYQIENEMNSYSQKSASECIAYLKENQLEKIEAGQGYGQNDIHKKLDNIDKDERK